MCYKKFSKFDISYTKTIGIKGRHVNIIKTTEAFKKFYGQVFLNNSLKKVVYYSINSESRNVEITGKLV